MNERYEKIINLPHHTSPKREPMQRSDRAAQFAPYAALSGYEDAVVETARLTDIKTELDEYEKKRINATLTDILSAEDDPRVSITHFHPDKKKEGGAYITTCGRIEKVDEYTRQIIISGGESISIDDVTDIQILL